MNRTEIQSLPSMQWCTGWSSWATSASPSSSLPPLAHLELCTAEVSLSWFTLLPLSGSGVTPWGTLAVILPPASVQTGRKSLQLLLTPCQAWCFYQGRPEKALNQPHDDPHLHFHPVSEHILWQTLSQNLPTLVHTWVCESGAVHVCRCRHKRITKKYIFIVLIVSCTFFPGLNWIYTDFFCSESLFLLILDYWFLLYISRHMHPHRVAFHLPLVATGDPFADTM